MFKLFGEIAGIRLRNERQNVTSNARCKIRLFPKRVVVLSHRSESVLTKRSPPTRMRSPGRIIMIIVIIITILTILIVRMRMCIYLCNVYIYIYICIHTICYVLCIYIYIHIYIHIHIHYIYTSYNAHSER